MAIHVTTQLWQWKRSNIDLMFTLPYMDMSCFENEVDSNQLASEKPADQGPNCFPPCLEVHEYANNWNSRR